MSFPKPENLQRRRVTATTRLIAAAPEAAALKLSVEWHKSIRALIARLVTIARFCEAVVCFTAAHFCEAFVVQLRAGAPQAIDSNDRHHRLDTSRPEGQNSTNNLKPCNAGG